MNESIHFSDFSISRGRIDFRCVHTNDGQIVKTNDVYFELSEPILPSYDAIALACACMCGNAFRIIRIDIPVSSNMQDALGKFTKSMVITCQGDTSSQIKPCTNTSPDILLSFSGGTDSLAALSLLPRKNVRLVATDFGGWFERERMGYEPHHPDYLLKTNLRTLNYNLNSWTFMGIGAILFSEYAQAPYFAFGSNLTDSIWHLMEKPPLAAAREAPLPFGRIGRQVCLTNGIGGAGVMRLVTHYYPDIVQQILDSLALPGSQKRYHKELILQCVKRRFPGEISYTPTEMHTTSRFGQIIETDLQLPYMIKHLGAEPLNAFVSDIPEEIYTMARKRRLTFYERLDPAFLATIPEQLQNDYTKRLDDAGIKLYDQTDFEDMLVLGNFAWHRYRKE